MSAKEITVLMVETIGYPLFLVRRTWVFATYDAQIEFLNARICASRGGL